MRTLDRRQPGHRTSIHYPGGGSVPLPLHKVVARNEAVASLAAAARSQVVRGGEFVTLPGTVIGFLRPGALRFCSPTTVEWGPGNNREQPPWLSAPAKAPFPEYHLLIEQAPGFFNAGKAHLGCHSMD